VSVTVRFLGSGDAFGSGGRFQTCIHVTSGATEFLIDCGASSLVAMKRFDVDPSRISTVLVTHLHGDHFGGIPFLVLDGQFSRRTQGFTVAGPAGTADRVRDTMEALFPRSSRAERRFGLDILELEPGQATAIGGLAVTAYEVPHASGAPALALRVTCEDRVIAYSGDCEWNESLPLVAHDADLFVCESLFFEKRVPWHLDYSTLREHLDDLTCRRIVLTHMSADMLGHDIDTERAEDGLEIEL
jgi:ribonuclease BN (tRNA processing enzyme)